MLQLARRLSLPALCALVAAAAVLACQSSADGRGQLRVELVDAPNPEVTEIWVNVTGVRAHEASAGWFTVSDTPVRVDLLTLQDRALELGLVDLPPGTITQLRLLVSREGNSVVAGGVEVPLSVPSGAQSGIKVKGPWRIDACTETAITLDFDGKRSIWYHPTGQGDRWILRPVVKTKRAAQAPGSCGGGGSCDPAQCASGACDAAGQCAAGGAGDTCDGGEACLSGRCEEGACLPGGPGDPCRVGDDCAGGLCTQDFTCADVGGGAGAPCQADAECLSNACVANVCEPGGQSQACAGPADCAQGFACVEGACEPQNPL